MMSKLAKCTMAHKLLLTNMAATRDFSGGKKFSSFDGILTGHICVRDDVTFHLEPSNSFDGDC